MKPCSPLALTLSLFLAVTAAGNAMASGQGIEKLMVVLRESEGNNKLDAALKPAGPLEIAEVDGKETELNMAWFAFIGDMHIRFVYDGPSMMSNLSSEDFEKLGLTAEKALKIAIKNIRRVYGKPNASEWHNGIMIVEGKSPDLDSSYFLDGDFWKAIARKHPDGVVVAVPKRGILLFAPASNQAAVGEMKQGLPYLTDNSAGMRVSAALYLYKEGSWSVYQAAPPKK